MSYTAQAEALAEDATGLGLSAALTVAMGHRARVEPDATRGLVAAALTLGATPADLFAWADPLASDVELLDAGGTLYDDAATMLREAKRIRSEAAEVAAAAREAIAAAHNAEHDTGTTETTQMAVSAAVSQAADCDCAIEILDDLIRRLTHAERRLGDVPDDLETAYEVPYSHIRSGRKLPHSGDFLTGDTATTKGAA